MPTSIPALPSPSCAFRRGRRHDDQPDRSTDRGGTHVRKPTTALDSRFSDTAAVATSWSDTRHALETAELFWITTVRNDGRPHVSPLVAVWLDDAIHFATGAAEQKAVNL